MEKTILVIVAVVLIIAPIVLLFRNGYDQIYKSLQQSKEKIKNLIPTWIKGK